MKQPALRSGVVSGETLVYQLEAQEIAVPLGSPAWYAWLEQAHSFSFRNDEGTFTAHKARASNRRGGWYWYAYRHRHGHVFRSYLGSSSRLTLERLRDAAQQLALRSEIPAREQPVTPCAPAELPPSSSGRSQPRLLATKCSIPRLPVYHIIRSRLISELNQGARERLTLVSAPAGSGKTTLLAAWARTANLPVAWLSLEAAENDPPRFLSYLVAALARLDARLGERYGSMADHGSSWEESLTSLVNDLAHVLTRDTVLILDDYHLITREPIHAALRFLIDHAPSRFHLFIGTRVDPPLPLARLRAHRQLSELRTEELRFVSAEMQAFVNAMGLALSGEAKDLLEQRAEGWIAGIQLLLLALRGHTDAAAFLRAFGSNHRFLLDYVSEEILAQQTPDMQRFLLRTCILERLCEPLCDSVTGEPGGQARLAALRRANLFVSALDEHYIFIYFRADWGELIRGYENDAILINRPGIQGFFLITDADRGMFLITYTPSAGGSAQDYTPERCRELVLDGVGKPDLAVEIVDIAPWQPAQLVAEHFGQGRVFLVGDAAHTMPPKLGLGVNTAIQSAQNLAWKLAAVLKGQASQELLATYQTERHPVGWLASEQSLVGPAASLLTQGSDDKLLPAGKKVSLFSLIAGYRYRSQAVLSEDAVPSEQAPIELLEKPEELTGLPGTRVPHLWVERQGQRISTLDLLDGRFVLLAGPYELIRKPGMCPETKRPRAAPASAPPAGSKSGRWPGKERPDSTWGACPSE